MVIGNISPILQMLTHFIHPTKLIVLKTMHFALLGSRDEAKEVLISELTKSTVAPQSHGVCFEKKTAQNGK